MAGAGGDRCRQIGAATQVVVGGVVSLVLAGCASPPSREDRMQSLRDESFGDGYRVAVMAEWVGPAPIEGWSLVTGDMLDAVELGIADAVSEQLPAAAEQYPRTVHKPTTWRSDLYRHMQGIEDRLRSEGYDAMLMVALDVSATPAEIYATGSLWRQTCRSMDFIIGQPGCTSGQFHMIERQDENGEWQRYERNIEVNAISGFIDMRSLASGKLLIDEDLPAIPCDDGTPGKAETKSGIVQTCVAAAQAMAVRRLEQTLAQR